MKTFLTILVGSSFVLATGLHAQEAEASPTPNKKHAGKDRPGKERPANAQPASAGKPKQEGRPGNEGRRTAAEAQPAKEPKHSPKSETAPKPHGKTKTPAAAADPSNRSAPPEESAGKRVAKPAPPADKAPAKKRKNSQDVPAKTATKPARPAPAEAPAPAPAEAQAERKARAKKPDAQTIEKIKTEHARFKAEPRPDRVPTVTFTENRRLEGSDQWQGEQYGVYRSYRPERHDENYYHSHYQRVELISGGYYYLNQGYWYPAWGYDNSHQYYAYDAPIYAGHRADPLDRVIADVQSALQDQGYYKGEVDGLLGPLTREALVGYQNDHGLYRTAVIDEPTLDSLGME